jgi:hypothetical protein
VSLTLLLDHAPASADPYLLRADVTKGPSVGQVHQSQIAESRQPGLTSSSGVWLIFLTTVRLPTVGTSAGAKFSGRTS